MEESTQELVDEGFVLNNEIKEKKKQLDKIKEALKAIAENDESKTLNGEKAIAKVSAHTSSSISTIDFIRVCEEVGVSQEGIASGLKVQVAKAKILLGEEQYSPIVQSYTNEYGVIKFKKL